MSDQRGNDPTDRPTHSIVLQGVLDISTARQLQSELSEALARGVPLALDAAQVERADTSILQLLGSFVRAAAACGVRWEWTEVSNAMRRAACLTGMDAALALPSDPVG